MKKILWCLLLISNMVLAAHSSDDSGKCAFVILNENKDFTFDSKEIVGTISNLFIPRCSQEFKYKDDFLYKKVCNENTVNRENILYARPMYTTCEYIKGKVILYHKENGYMKTCNSQQSVDPNKYKTDPDFPGVKIFEFKYPKDFMDTVDCKIKGK